MEASRSNVKGRRIVREREQKCSAVQAGRKERRSLQCNALQSRLKGKKVQAGQPSACWKEGNKSNQCSAGSQIWTDVDSHIISSVSISMHPNLGVSHEKECFP